MRRRATIGLAALLLAACNTAVPEPTPTSASTEAPAAAPARTPIPVAGRLDDLLDSRTALPQRYASSVSWVEFDYPAGWVAEGYVGETAGRAEWILLSDQPAFLADPLSPANTGAVIGVVSWADVVKLDAAVMTPDPPRFLQITPEPAIVADKLAFYSTWSGRMCLGIGCCIAVDGAQDIWLDGRRGAHGYGKISLCPRGLPTPEGVAACELDTYLIVVEAASPDGYITVLGLGEHLSQHQTLFLEIAATMTLA